MYQEATMSKQGKYRIDYKTVSILWCTICKFMDNPHFHTHCENTEGNNNVMEKCVEKISLLEKIRRFILIYAFIHSFKINNVTTIGTDKLIIDINIRQIDINSGENTSMNNIISANTV
jgi:recombinational DNA repair protein RecR